MSVSVQLPGQGSGDLAMLQLDQADQWLGEVRPRLIGASPKVVEAFGIVAKHVNAARNVGLSAEREISGLLDDNKVYPKGRHEEASKVLAQIQGTVDGLKQAQVAALTATKLLEEEALPRFEGDTAQEALLRDELRDILSRSNDVTATLSRLATRPRFAGLVVSEFGRGLFEERGMTEREVEERYGLVRNEAMLWAAEHGTDAQRQAALRIPLGEKMQAAVVSASSGAQLKLEPLAGRVSRLGMRLMEEDARRVREAGRGR